MKGKFLELNIAISRKKKYIVLKIALRNSERK